MKIYFDIDDKKKTTSYRLDLNPYEAQVLIDILERVPVTRLEEWYIYTMFRRVKKIDKTNKIKATKKANSIKIKTSISRVIEAIEELQVKGKDITPYAVSKIAKISYNTAKKYLNEINKDNK